MSISDLGQRWADAERTADTQALARILTDDFVAVGPAGFVLGKQEWLARYDSGDLTHDTLTWEPQRAHEHGATTIVVGVQEQSSSWQGHDASGKFRVTQVITDGQQIAALHLSAIRPQAVS